MHTVYLSIGSNLGDKKAHIKSALELCGSLFGTCCLSAFYESEAWGYESSNTYYNGALSFRTSMSGQDIWKKIEAIESELGRTRSGLGYQDRPIDLDVLLIEDLVENGELTLPHPRMHLRDFVLKPLVDLGDPVHPVLNEKASILLEKISDSSILREVRI